MARKKKKPVCTERVLEELAAIGFARATDCLYVQDNNLMVKPSKELTPEAGAAIASIERTTGGLKVKFYDKLRALELLGKHMGMFDGDRAKDGQEKTNLLEAILTATREEVDTDGIPELQQAADPGNELVEPSESARL